MKQEKAMNYENAQRPPEKSGDLCPDDLMPATENFLINENAGTAPSGITYHDAQGRITDADESARRILPKAHDEWFGLKFSDPKLQVIQSDGRKLTDEQDPVKIALTGGEIVVEVLLGFQQPDEAVVQWLLVTAIPVASANGSKVDRVVCHIRDISEKVHSERFPQFRLDLVKKLREIVELIGVDAQDSAIACREVIRFLPIFLTFPEATHVKIRLEDKTFTSKKFNKSIYTRVSGIAVKNHDIGEIAFHYQVDPAVCMHAPGLNSDKILRETLADWLGFISTVVQKNQEINELKDEALSAYDRTIEAWSAALETSDKEASGHTRRVTDLAVELAREMGFPEEELADVRRGALLHDIGKISIPDEIILKPGKLTEDEFDIVKKHPEFTQKWLSQIELLKPALQIPYYHHEKWDGTGYPQGLSGEEIPLVARMFSIVDVWDVLISDRPYRRAMSKEEALDMILSESGSQFDPDVVKHFVDVLQQEKRLSTSSGLKINAFGQARVWRFNQPVTIKEWEVYAARDLFFLFLAFSRGLTKEQVGLHMWPDLSPDELDVRFKNTIYRLRRALDKQTILLTDDRYHFNRMIEYRYDVEYFTTLIQKAKEETDSAIKITHLIKAVEQYHGDYLQEIEENWVVKHQEHYRMMFLEALVEVAGLFFERQDLESALNYVNQALQEDPIFEAAHRLAIQIYAKSGDRAGVIRQYETLQTSLEEDYDVSPSKQTRELYESLIQS